MHERRAGNLDGVAACESFERLYSCRLTGLLLPGFAGQKDSVSMS